MKTIIIIRGVPGSGKTTLAKRIALAIWAEQNVGSRKNAVICEADQFFTGTDGKYRFVPRLIPAAHEWCQRKARRAAEAGTETIIISNTGTIIPHIQFYRDLATAYGYDWQEIVCFSKFKSIHDVPTESMERMRDNLRFSLIDELQKGLLP